MNKKIKTNVYKLILLLILLASLFYQWNIVIYIFIVLFSISAIATIIALMLPQHIYTSYVEKEKEMALIDLQNPLDNSLLSFVSSLLFIYFGWVNVGMFVLVASALIQVVTYRIAQAYEKTYRK